MLKLIHFTKSKKLNYLSGESFLKSDQRKGFKDNLLVGEEDNTPFNKLEQIKTTY